MKPVIPWESPISNIGAIDKELLKFYFDQAEKCLKASVDLSERISARCYALLATIIPIMGVIVGTLAKNVIFEEQMSIEAVCFLFCALVPAVICFGLLLWAVFPKNYTFIGSNPRDKIQANIYDNPDFVGDHSYKLMLTFEIEEYQGRIDYADLQNAQRITRVKYAFYVILGTLLLLIAGLITL